MTRSFATPEAEIDRLKALARYNVLDTAGEQVFDELTRLAAYFCHAPIALISLLDEHRAWVKSATGVTIEEAPRSISFCDVTIREPRMLIVPDACQDERFCNNPFVTRDPKIRFYAGAPLISPGGFILGTLCVIDYRPRELTDEQKEILRALANQTITQLELRLSVSEVASRTLELRQAHLALRESENRFRALFEQAGVGVALIETATGRFLETNQKFRDIVGYDAEELFAISFPSLVHSDVDHPPGHAPESARMAELLAGTIREFSLEQRLTTKDGSEVWVEVTVSARCEEGTSGVCHIVVIQDITARKQAEKKVAEAFEKELLLRREIHHRVKNNLQIISSLLYLQSTQVTDASSQEMLRASQARTRSIALIHEKLYHSEELTRIEFAGYARQLISDLILAYPAPSQIDLRIDAGGQYLDLDSAIPCGLIITELVSNALKHAFTNQSHGIIEISLKCKVGQPFELTVRDNGTGLPPDFRPEEASTFGLKLIRDLSRQLGGSVDFQTAGGTVVKVTFSSREMCAEAA